MNYSSNGNQLMSLSFESLSPRALNRLQQYIDGKTEDVCKDVADLQRAVVIANQALSAQYNIGMTAEMAKQMLPEGTAYFQNIVQAAHQNIISVVRGDYRRD